MGFFAAVFAATTLALQWHLAGALLALPFIVFAALGLLAAYLIRTGHWVRPVPKRAAGHHVEQHRRGRSAPNLRTIFSTVLAACPTVASRWRACSNQMTDRTGAPPPRGVLRTPRTAAGAVAASCSRWLLCTISITLFTNTRKLPISPATAMRTDRPRSQHLPPTATVRFTALPRPAAPAAKQTIKALAVAADDLPSAFGIAIYTIQ